MQLLVPIGYSGNIRYTPIRTPGYPLIAVAFADRRGRGCLGLSLHSTTARLWCCVCLCVCVQWSGGFQPHTHPQNKSNVTDRSVNSIGLELSTAIPANNLKRLNLFLPVLRNSGSPSAGVIPDCTQYTSGLRLYAIRSTIGECNRILDLLIIIFIIIIA